ncbi:MAG: BatA domain-containing protein [Bacteroidia bacterium]|nr:BatA domain-containing protein [Bacteroidia bacterium]
MMFLSPVALWGLLTLAVPVIVHFFNFQRPRQVLFSNVALVKEVQRSVVRRIKLRQWLILLIRMAAVAAIVLALAGPVLTERGGLVQGGRSVAIVLDNSPSMTAGNDQGVYFQQAISMARNIVKAYSSTDEYLIMTGANLQPEAYFSTQQEALDQLQALQTEPNTRSHYEILGFGSRFFGRAQYPARELYLISDFQRATMAADSGGVSSPDSTIRFHYIPLATRPTQNIYITDHQITSRVIERGKPVNLRMQLVNGGDQPVRDLSVRVMLADKAVAIATVTLSPGETQQLDLTMTPETAGWLSGYIEVEDNPINFDNRRYISLYVPDKEKILIAESQPSRELRILFGQLFTTFETTFIPGRNLNALELNDYKAIILSGQRDMPPGLGEKLAAYLDQGGSILLLPGEGLDLPAMNAFLDQVKAGQFQEMVRYPDGVRASGADLAHPAFEGIYTRQKADQQFDAPMVFKLYPLVTQGQRVLSRILTLDNQLPVLTEVQTGSGLLLISALSMEQTWTDLPISGIFTPLMYRLAQLMTQPKDALSGSQVIGQFVPLPVVGEGEGIIQLVHTDGTSYAPGQYLRGGATVLSFENLDLPPGNYQLVQADRVLRHLSFNVSDTESRLAYLDAAALREYLNRQQLGEIDVMEAQPDLVANRIQTEQYGRPLWAWFLIAALVFLLTEIALLTAQRTPAPASA